MLAGGGGAGSCLGLLVGFGEQYSLLKLKNQLRDKAVRQIKIQQTIFLRMKLIKKMTWWVNWYLHISLSN